MVTSRWWLCMGLFLMACTPPAAETVVQATLELTRTVPTEALQSTVMATAVADDTAVPTHTPTPIADTPTPLPTETAVPTKTPPPTDIPVPTNTPRPIATIDPAYAIMVAANGVEFSLDTRIALTVYPSLSDGALPYREFSFAPDDVRCEMGCIIIYEVASFGAEIPGGDFIIDELIASLAVGDAENIPTWGSAILLQTQEQLFPFASGMGVRAIVMRGQDGFFANNEAVVYDYHGLTADGRYYINVTIPIDIPFLIDGYDPAQNTNPNAHPIPELPSAYEQVVALMYEYNREIEALIEALPDAEFSPDLAWLDALVASIVVGEE